MCERFGCLPSQLEREDAYLWRLLTIEKLGRRPDDDPDPYGLDPESML